MEQAQILIKKLGMALNELPAVYDQLWLFLLPQAAPSSDGIQGGSIASERAPLVVEVLDLLDIREKQSSDLYPIDHGERRLGILPTLSSWVRFVDEKMIMDNRQFMPPYRFIACCGSCVFLDQADAVLPGAGVCTGKRMPHWEPKTVGTECAWLAAQMDYIQDQPWMYRLADPDRPSSITRLLHDVRSIVGTEETIKLVCLNEGCGWPVKIMSHGAWYKCTGCGDAWSFDEVRNRAAARKPITIKEAVERSGCSKSLLHEYIRLGKIKALSVRNGSAKLYDPVEVMQVTMESRYRKRS